MTQGDVAEMVGISPSALDTTTDYLLLGIKHTCEMEECELYEDLNRLFRAYGMENRL